MKNKVNLVTTIFFLLFVGSCTSDEIETEYVGGESKSLTIVHDSIKVNNANNLRTPSTRLFYDGGFKLFDLESVTMYSLDANFQIEDLLVSQGHGPNEIPSLGATFYAVNKSENIGLSVIGGSYDYHVMDTSYDRFHSAPIDWKTDVSPKLLSKKPDPENPRQYNLAYYSTIKVPIEDNVMLLPVRSSQKPYSDFNSTVDDYVKSAYLFARIDANTGEFIEMVGNHPSNLLNETVADDFLISHFDRSNDGFYYVGFMADTLIYKYSSEMKLINSFGNKGSIVQNLLTKIEATSESLYLKSYKEQMSNMDFFFSVSVFNEGDILFRSGKLDTKRRGVLQVYYKYRLTNELLVPSRLEISAQKNNTFYSNPILSNDGLYIHTFTITSNN